MVNSSKVATVETNKDPRNDDNFACSCKSFKCNFNHHHRDSLEAFGVPWWRHASVAREPQRHAFGAHSQNTGPWNGKNAGLFFSPSSWPSAGGSLPSMELFSWAKRGNLVQGTVTRDTLTGQPPRTLPRSRPAVNVRAWERGFVLESSGIFTPSPGASLSGERKHKMSSSNEKKKKNLTQNTCVAPALQDVPPCLRANARITGRKPLVVGKTTFAQRNLWCATVGLSFCGQLEFFFSFSSSSTLLVSVVFWCVSPHFSSASLPPVKTCRPFLCVANSLSSKRGIRISNCAEPKLRY